MNRRLNSLVATVALIALLLPSFALQASPAPTGVVATAAPVGASSDVNREHLGSHWPQSGHIGHAVGGHPAGSR